jgi:hypothetical protein
MPWHECCKMDERLRFVAQLLEGEQMSDLARDGIEPSTRGFSVRRRDRFGAGKPKKLEDFPQCRPNRPPDRAHAEPRPGRPTEPQRGAHAGQQVTRIGTERGTEPRGFEGPGEAGETLTSAGR